jgi:membrane carboxypeptidase/penicillin-binding protein
MVPPRVSSRVSGGTWPAAIWSRFMRSALAGEQPGRFPRPDTSLVQLALDLKQGCLPNRFTPASEVASVVYLKASAPTRTCREPDRPVAGVVPALVGGAAAKDGRVAGGGGAVAGAAPAGR